MAKTVKIFKKALGTFFSHLQALTNCKVSEKSNERFPRKSVADVRTNGWTDVRTRLLRSQRPVGRETKKNDYPTDESVYTPAEMREMRRQSVDVYTKTWDEYFSNTADELKMYQIFSISLMTKQAKNINQCNEFGREFEDLLTSHFVEEKSFTAQYDEPREKLSIRHQLVPKKSFTMNWKRTNGMFSDICCPRVVELER